MTWLPSTFNPGFEAYSNNSQPPMGKSSSSIRAESRSTPPFGQPRGPLRESLRSMMQKQDFELGIIAGTSHSLTNIGTGRPSFMGTHWETTDLNAGLFARYHFHDNWAINSAFHYARIHSADSLSGEGSGRYSRGFYFSNQIFELNLKGEFFIPELLRNYPWDIYGYLGVAVFYHDPDLHVPDPPPSNHTEESYSNIQPAIPMGVGVIYTINDNFRFGFDIGHRITFTDYLDGFSRPYSDGNDAYFLGSFKLSYFFGETRMIPY